MNRSTFAVPEAVTFHQALSLTQSLLDQMVAGELSSAEFEEAITELLKTENGARGFFVTYLTCEYSLADSPSPEVVQALRSNPETVAELLVKNLAMSAAQALAHHRHGNAEMAQGSEQVRLRTTQLIKLTDLPAVRQKSQLLWKSAATGEGRYTAFLERWDYDQEQKQLICQALEQLRLEESK